MNLLGRDFKQLGGLRGENALTVKVFCSAAAVLFVIGIIKLVIFNTTKDERTKEDNQTWWLPMVIATILCVVALIMIFWR